MANIKFDKAPSAASGAPKPAPAPAPAPKPSPDPSKADTRENLNTTFGAPKE